MADYRFVTEWDVPAPIDGVWALIADTLRWPEWWRGVVAVEQLERGAPDGIGAVARYTWRSLLPYDLVFDMRATRIEAPHILEGTASGQLEGEGRWRLTETAEGTHVRYEWDVRTTEWWMNLLAPLAKPLFAWNHDVVMSWGEQGLRRQLGLPESARRSH